MTTATNVPDNSFLARCKQDLDPSNATSYNRQSTLWLVAAGVTFVAFTALAITAFVYSSLMFAASAPFVALGSLVLAFPAANIVKNFLEYSKSSAAHANRYQTIQGHYATLSQKTPHQIQDELAARGITWLQIPGMAAGSPQNVTALNPLLAQAKYLDEKIQEMYLSKQDLINEARNLATTNFAANQNNISNLRLTALFTENKILHTKIQAAFTNAVLRKGNFGGSLEDIADLTEITPVDHALADACSDQTGINNFLIFKRPYTPPITYMDVQRMTIPELGSRLVMTLNLSP